MGVPVNPGATGGTSGVSLIAACLPSTNPAGAVAGWNLFSRAAISFEVRATLCWRELDSNHQFPMTGCGPCHGHHATIRMRE